MITDKKEIIRELLLSENRGYVLTIKVKSMETLIKTAVRSVDHQYINLENTCLYGHPLPKTSLKLADIEWVKRSRVLYSNPVYENIRHIKNNIRDIRIGMRAIKSGNQLF